MLALVSLEWLDGFDKKMKKSLSGCSECGDDTAILTQVSSGPEVILLCTDCYNLKHSNETQNQISYEEEKS